MKTTKIGDSNKKNRIIGLLLPIILFAALAAFLVMRGAQQGDSRGGSAGTGGLDAQGSLVIPLTDVSQTATFYPVYAGGVELEILAVRATDGTVRTAFNTCQICYDSGRGYYQQQGEYFVCQNCGNRFHTDDVEVIRGGCNPIPITDNYKITEEEQITIPSDFLEEASVLFANWRR